MQKAKTLAGFDGCLLTITNPWLDSCKTNDRVKYSLRWSKNRKKENEQRENKKLLSLLYNYNHWSNIPKEYIKEIV